MRSSTTQNACWQTPECHQQSVHLLWQLIVNRAGVRLPSMQASLEMVGTCFRLADNADTQQMKTRQRVNKAADRQWYYVNNPHVPTPPIHC